MSDDKSVSAETDVGARGALSPAAARALAEAEARRRQRASSEPQRAEEVGRNGPDPTRYGDWEKRGIASDF